MGREDARYRRGRSGRPYERAKARVFATETHCARCGGLVDKDLPHRDPVTGRVNVWSKTFGHTEELDAGGHPLVGRLEHLHCNVVAGAQYGNAKRAPDQRPVLRVSGDLDGDAPPLTPRPRT